MTSGLAATPTESMATHTPTETMNQRTTDPLNEWRLGRRIAKALRLTPVNGDKYRTEWGEKNPIALTKALRAILK
jgi:hypothetical protein